MGINNNLLPCVVSLDPTSYRIDFLPPALRRWRNLCEFNRRPLFISGMTTSQENAAGDQRDTVGWERGSLAPDEPKKVAWATARESTFHLLDFCVHKKGFEFAKSVGRSIAPIHGRAAS